MKILNFIKTGPKSEPESENGSETEAESESGSGQDTEQRIQRLKGAQYVYAKNGHLTEESVPVQMLLL